jgi:cellulose synthase (UDP-forming)
MNITVAKLDMLLVMLIPSILGSILVSQYLYGNLRWPFVSILYEVMQSIHLTFGILKLLINPRAPKFQVTPKGEVLEENFISSLAKPFYFILCINIAAIIQGLISYQNATEQGGMILFITVWAICDLLFLLSALGITFERRQRRSSPRAIVEEPVRLHAKNGEMLRGVMIDASVSGARIRFACIPEDLDNLPTNDEVVIDLPTRLISFTCSIQKAVMENSTYAIIGVAYHLQTTNADRIAVDIAYGSSEQIRKNNKLHEQGQNILQGLFNILYFALVPGLGHIYFLISKPFKKLGKFQKNFKTRGHHA